MLTVIKTTEKSFNKLPDNSALQFSCEQDYLLMLCREDGFKVLAENLLDLMVAKIIQHEFFHLLLK